MKILVIGGTNFVGRAFVEAALEHGHELTLFNRGQRNPGLFPEVERILGDRCEDIELLAGRTWDAVYDSCGYYPKVVGISTGALISRAKSYLFISSISVYKRFDIPNQDEQGEVATLQGPVVEEITPETYGALKALCESVVRETYGTHATIVRPGLVVGPNDYSDRFTYWVERMDRGGEVLVPDVKDQPIQFIDTRDLALFSLKLLEDRVTGTFNATGPLQAYLLGDVLQECAAGTPACLSWVSPEFLKAEGVEPWSDMPLVMGFDGEKFGQHDVTHATRAGLTFRSLPEIVQDTRDWVRTRPEGHAWKAGLSADREAKLLAAWTRRV